MTFPVDRAQFRSVSAATRSDLLWTKEINAAQPNLRRTVGGEAVSSDCLDGDLADEDCVLWVGEEFASLLDIHTVPTVLVLPPSF